MAISSVKTSSVINGSPKSRSLLVGNLTSATPTAYVALALKNPPYVSVLRWYDGYGSAYSDPATLPATTVDQVLWSPSGNDLFVIIDYLLSVYAWTNSSGFGTRYATVTDGGYTKDPISINPAGNTIIAGNLFSPCITAYPFTSGTGFGTKYANPATVPPSFVYSIDWSPSGNDVAVGHADSPFVSVYPWSSGFGTKYANPATLPAGTPYGLKFSPSGNTIAIGSTDTPFVQAYPWSSGFGTKYANPATLPAGGFVRGITWSPSGNDIIMGHSSASYISAYPWSSGFGTKYANPAILPNNTVDRTAWLPSGNAVFAATGTMYSLVASSIATYRWSSGFDSFYKSPSIAISNVIQDVNVK